jgi:hypothetical protein
MPENVRMVNQQICIGLVALFFFIAIGPITGPSSSQPPDGPPSGRGPKDKWSEDFETNTTTGTLVKAQILSGKVQLDSDIISWRRPFDHPVMDHDSMGFDSEGIRGISIIFDEGLFKMWYGGYNGDHFMMGYATSPDGINWTRGNGGNPVMALGPDGSWDDHDLWGAQVIKEATTYRMWYDAGDGAINRVGYAYSEDGVHWTKYDKNPVLTPDNSGFDSTHVGVECVFHQGGSYIMMFIGNAGHGYDSSMGIATSSDGYHWAKNSEPIFSLGAAGKFDSVAYRSAAVYTLDGKHIMFYSGDDGTVYRIGAAESTDYLTWTRLNDGNYIIGNGTAGSWDEDMMIEKAIQRTNGRYYMWYCGGTVRHGVIPYTGYRTKVGLLISNYYPDGSITSEKIDLPDGMGWDMARLWKEEPVGTKLQLSVLDGTTGMPIANLSKFNGTEVDLTMLNALGTRSIMLKAELYSSGPNTPALGEWNVTWKSLGEPFIEIKSPMDEDIIDAGPFMMTGVAGVKQGGQLKSLEWKVDSGDWAAMNLSINWSVQVPTLSSGKHILTARATSASEHTASDSILVVVKYSQKMLCVITYPREGQEVAGLTPVRGVAFDPAGLITKGKLDIGPKATGFDIQLSRWGIKYNMSVLPGGKTVIKASISDGHGNEAWDTVNITVIPPPKVTILSPTDGQRIKDSSFVLNVKLEHPGTTALHVDVFTNGVKVSSTDAVPGVVTLNPDSPEKRGNFTVTVKAKDQWGQVGEDTNTPYRYIKPKPYKTWVIPFPWWIIVIICVCCAADVIYRYHTRNEHNELAIVPHNRRLYYK